MLWWTGRGLVRPVAISMWMGLLAAVIPGTAGALTFGLNTEFDTGVTGPFALVEITEDSGALNFVITLNADELGAGADLHQFYFNLDASITGLAISNTDAPTTEYLLMSNPSVAGGAGSDFDWGVHFGSGAGAKGNGSLESASFTLTADQDLSLDDLFLSSFASGGSIPVQFAAHIQGTSALTGATSETIGGGMFPPGGTIPEPSTASLLAGALMLLAGRSRWSRSRSQRMPLAR